MPPGPLTGGAHYLEDLRNRNVPVSRFARRWLPLSTATSGSRTICLLAYGSAAAIDSRLEGQVGDVTSGASPRDLQPGDRSRFGSGRDRRNPRRGPRNRGLGSTRR